MAYWKSYSQASSSDPLPPKPGFLPDHFASPLQEGLPRSPSPSAPHLDLLFSSPQPHSSHALHSLLPRGHSILCSSHTVLPALSAGCPAISLLQEHTALCFTHATPTEPSSSMPLSLPPGSLPGLLPLPNDLRVDLRSEELSHSSQMLLPSLAVSVAGACSGLASVLTSSGCPALKEPADQWEKNWPGWGRC